MKTSSGVNGRSKKAPWDLYHLNFAQYPAATSNTDPVSSQESWHKYATSGIIYSIFNISSAYGGNTVSVIRLAATGAMLLHLILYFSPSLAHVIVNPWIPSFAVL